MENWKSMKKIKKLMTLICYKRIDVLILLHNYVNVLIPTKIEKVEFFSNQ